LRVSAESSRAMEAYKAERRILIKKGVPPALPGRQQQFDIFGSPSKKLQEVSRQAHIKENLDGRV